MRTVTKYKGYFHINHNITLPEYYNPYTLNIFSDASFGIKGKKRGAYAVVCVCCDTIIDEFRAFCGDHTIVVSETRGIRRALDMGLRYSSQYQYINIFSDSQLSIQSIRDFIYHWKYNEKKKCFLNTNGAIVHNQGLILECNQLYSVLCQRTHTQLLHQKGHVDSGYSEIVNAVDVFKKSNYVNGNIDLNFIRYISTWNNYVDDKATKKLKNDRSRYSYNDPFEYKPKEICNPRGFQEAFVKI